MIIGALGCGGCSGKGGDGDPANGGGDGQSNSSSAFGSVDGLCAATCNKDHTCDTHVDLQTCTNKCRTELAGAADKLRADYLSRATDCYTAADCASVLGGDAGRTCDDEAVAALSPTEKGTAFCSALGTALDKCGASLDKAACFNLVKMYDDGALDEAQQCLSKACSSLSACVDATL